MKWQWNGNGMAIMLARSFKRIKSLLKPKIYISFNTSKLKYLEFSCWLNSGLSIHNLEIMKDKKDEM